MEYPNWFATSESKSNFKKYLQEFRGKKNLKFLQIGAYTGDASVWIAENIFISNDCTLIDVDTWQGSNEEIHKGFDWLNVEDTYDIKVKRYKNIIKHKTTSKEYLSKCNELFDFIYIDGDHTSDGVYQDASLAFPLLKSGGVMALDDYLWNHDTNNPELEPKQGIDKFLKDVKGRIELLYMDYQVWIKKV